MSKKDHTKIEELEIRISDLDNQLKRAVADYRNLETRVKEGRSELTAWGTIELINKLLVVLDYLEQATLGISEEEKKSSWFRGVEMAVKQFKEVLKGEGLEEISADPSASLGTGSQFNPTLHEAVDTAEGEENSILKIARKGYTIRGKVIRPAQVVVGRSNDEGLPNKGDGSTSQGSSKEGSPNIS